MTLDEISPRGDAQAVLAELQIVLTAKPMTTVEIAHELALGGSTAARWVRKLKHANLIYVSSYVQPANVYVAKYSWGFSEDCEKPVSRFVKTRNNPLVPKPNYKKSDEAIENLARRKLLRQFSKIQPYCDSLIWLTFGAAQPNHNLDVK